MNSLRAQRILNNERKRFKISERTARYDLGNLVEKQLLTKIGDKKSTKYEYK